MRDNAFPFPFDPAGRERHVIVESRTGGGKTFALLCLAQRSRLAVDLFDKGDSYAAIRRSIVSRSNGGRKRRVDPSERLGNRVIEGGAGRVQR